jgi:hypothetical protein
MTNRDHERIDSGTLHLGSGSVIASFYENRPALTVVAHGIRIKVEELASGRLIIVSVNTGTSKMCGSLSLAWV